MQTIGYIRVSTEDQANHGVSLADQRRAIETYAREQGLLELEIIEDAGQSGKDLNRPGMQRLLAWCAQGGVERVVFYNWDRLTRSVVDNHYLRERVFRAKGIQVCSLTEPPDDGSASAFMVNGMQAVVSEYLRRIISERTKAALRGKRERGELVGAVPYGYDLAEDGVHLLPNESELGVVRQIRRWHDRGASLRAIGRHLSEEQVPTKRGGQWGLSNVRRIINREEVI